MWRRMFIWMVAMAMAASLLACSGSDKTTDDGTPSGGTVPSIALPSPVPGGMPVPDPSAMLPVAGEEIVTKSVGTHRDSYGNPVPVRGATATYEERMSDPRVSGTHEVVVNLDKDGYMWGTSVIRNDGGSWVGSWTGLENGGYFAERFMFEDFVGVGGYEGLTYHRNARFWGATLKRVPGDYLTTSGWLESADGSAVPPPPGEGSQSWGDAVSGYATFVGEGAKWRFDNTMTDPRADGTLVVAFKGTRQVGEERGKSYWGGWVLSNDGGTWVCPHFTGARRADGSEHFNYCKARGTGFYKGFVYHSQWHFFEPFTAASRIAATGWISKTTQQTDK